MLTSVDTTSSGIAFSLKHEMWRREKRMSTVFTTVVVNKLSAHTIQPLRVKQLQIPYKEKPWRNALVNNSKCRILGFDNRTANAAIKKGSRTAHSILTIDTGSNVIPRIKERKEKGEMLAV